MFNDENEFAQNWQLINNTAYEYEILNDITDSGQIQPYLNITKGAEADGSYDDAMFIYFGDSTPKHITVMMWTDDPNIETCDLRLTTIDKSEQTNITKYKPPTPTPTPPTPAPTPKTNTTNSTKTPAPPTPPPTPEVPPSPKVGNFSKVPWQDVVFFRFGYFNYQKMNLVSMVNKFTNGAWYKVDLIMDWGNQAVTVYVNETQLASDIFFTQNKQTIASANALVIYNLSPGGRCSYKQL